MLTRAANSDRARVVRSLLSLAVVGALLVVSLVPMPGPRRGVMNTSSPSVALHHWERRDRMQSVTWAEAIQAAKSVTSKGRGFFSVDDLSDIGATIYADMGYLGLEEANLNANPCADQPPDDASRP
jgi:hypothetical protein